MKIYPIQVSSDQYQNQKVFSYFIEPNIKRVFNLQKAEQIKGLQIVQYKPLQKGMDVQLQDGRTVKPEDVLEEIPEINCIGLIFLPSLSYLEDFLRKYSFSDKLSSQSVFQYMIKDKNGIIETENRKFIMMYHSMSKDVFMDERYLSTISKFGENITHVLDSPEGNLPLLVRSKAYSFSDNIK